LSIRLADETVAENQCDHQGGNTMARSAWMAAALAVGFGAMAQSAMAD
jgi:hypothetical protein